MIINITIPADSVAAMILPFMGLALCILVARADLRQ